VLFCQLVPVLQEANARVRQRQNGCVHTVHRLGHRPAWPPVYAVQWLLERFTIRSAGEHFTRRQLPLVKAAGFQVVESERLKAGAAERIHAVKPG
jgi:hypothetical protein